ncbi:MAG TPA: hypothetical protein VFJ85_06160 [Acidimicrobiales bacterium]|nr:hypothetical protein [Acidimicrobiales bacterium]
MRVCIELGVTAVGLDDLSSLQGRRVSVALADRSCVDGAILEGVVDGGQLWLHAAGDDVFVDLDDVIDVWEPEGARCRPAADPLLSLDDPPVTPRRSLRR